MYPGKFKPSTHVTVNDHFGHTEAGLFCQIYKPLLGLSLNGPQSSIIGHALPNMAATIIRALVRVPMGSALQIKPGPGYWIAGAAPTMVLDEDPNHEDWIWMDAVPWTLPDLSTLWSVYAAKDHSLFPPPPPPPPPPPATPFTMGTSFPLAPLLARGTTYVSTIPPISSMYAYSPQGTGIAYSVVADVGTVGALGTQAYGGDHLLLPLAEGTPILGAGTISVPGISHTGPDAIVEVSNVDIIPHQFYWHMPP